MKPSPEDIIQAIYDAAEKGLRVSVVSNDCPAGPVELAPDTLSALEEIQVNVMGQGGLATEETLALFLYRLKAGQPEQYVGEVGTDGQEITFSGSTKYVIVLSPEPDAQLEVSFNDGSSFIPVPAQGQLSIHCHIYDIRIRAGSGTAKYAILVTV